MDSFNIPQSPLMPLIAGALGPWRRILSFYRSPFIVKIRAVEMPSTVGRGVIKWRDAHTGRVHVSIRSSGCGCIHT